MNHMLKTGVHRGTPVLFQLLLQAPEQLWVKEVLDRDAQAVAQFLDRRYGRAAVAAADYVVHCGLSHSAHAAQLVDGDVLLAADLQNALLYRLSDIHGHHLISRRWYTFALEKINPFELK